MYIAAHLIILAIYTFLLIHLNMPHLGPMDHLSWKIYIFLGIFIFEFVVNLIVTIHAKRLVNIKKIVQDSLIVGLLAMVAYSVFCDISYKFDVSYGKIILTVTILFFIAAGYLTENILREVSPKINDPLNTIYAVK